MKAANYETVIIEGPHIQDGNGLRWRGEVITIELGPKLHLVADTINYLFAGEEHTDDMITDLAIFDA